MFSWQVLSATLRLPCSATKQYSAIPTVHGQALGRLSPTLTWRAAQTPNDLLGILIHKACFAAHRVFGWIVRLHLGPLCLAASQCHGRISQLFTTSLPVCNSQPTHLPETCTVAKLIASCSVAAHPCFLLSLSRAFVPLLGCSSTVPFLVTSKHLNSDQSAHYRDCGLLEHRCRHSHRSCH